MKNILRITASSLCAIALIGCQQNSTSETSETVKSAPVKKEALTIESVSTETIQNARAYPEIWQTYGGTYDEQRFAGLEQINKKNVADLGIAWTYDLATSRGVEATPIVVDGVMYLTGAWSIVYALDARTGEELWVYDPEVSGEDAAKGCCDVINRGVAVYGGKVFVGVFDGRLEALDAKTGEVVWSKVTVDQSKPYTITGAPRVVKGKVLIGNGGAELGVRGYVSAYDVETGEKVWRFYTAPNPEKKPDGEISDEIFAKLANDTWGDDGAWTTDGGGGTVWDSIVYDEVNDQILVGVGNSSPYNDKIRDPNSDGDNLFISSILALDADTGAYKWHFQTTPRDRWDYTATQTIILADLPVGENGANRRVAMQAPKNGFFYVLDAKTGEFISGEKYEPNMTWATGLDENGRPIEAPGARDSSGTGFLAIPAPAGAHNWHPMAYNPQTGLVYIPAQQMAQMMQDHPEGGTGKSKWNIGYNFAAGLPTTYDAETLAAVRKSVSGSLVAWDPVAQEAKWTVRHEKPFNGGVLTTKSNLVFQGDTAGRFSAYDAETGERLWSKLVNSGIQAAPSTFELDGEQYVSIATGWGGSWGLNWGFAWEPAVAPDVGHVVTFKLGAKGAAPEVFEAYMDRTPKAKPMGDAETLALGFQRYSDNCMVCHGPLAISSGVVPDLRWSYLSGDAEMWNDVVMKGSLTDNGMTAFDKVINVEDSEAIRAYVIDQAWLAVKNGDAQAPAEEE